MVISRESSSNKLWAYTVYYTLLIPCMQIGKHFDCLLTSVSDQCQTFLHLRKHSSSRQYRISSDTAQEMAESEESQGKKKSIKLYLGSNPSICEHRL